jgi:hypothetical protein
VKRLNLVLQIIFKKPLLPAVIFKYFCLPRQKVILMGEIEFVKEKIYFFSFFYKVSVKKRRKTYGCGFKSDW